MGSKGLLCFTGRVAAEKAEGDQIGVEGGANRRMSDGDRGRGRKGEKGRERERREG